MNITRLIIFLLFSALVANFYTENSNASSHELPLSDALPFGIIRHCLSTGKTLEQLIDEYPDSEKRILEMCLLCTEKEDTNVLRSIPSQRVIEFFTDQGLVDHVKPLEKATEGCTLTYGHACGVEFDSHGPVERKVIELLKGVQRTRRLTRFLDIGAGYGHFAEKVAKSFTDEESDLVAIDLCEAISVQCFHAARILDKFNNINFYPCNLFGRLRYHMGLLGHEYDVSTCLNVFHFMKPNNFIDAVADIARITSPGGYHVAVTKTPYSYGEDSLITKEFRRRSQDEECEHPGYFTEEDMVCLRWFVIRAPFYFMEETILRKAFESNDFTVQEIGYYSEKQAYPREFCYIVAQKN